MAQWLVETTDVPSRKDKESDWHEVGAFARRQDAAKKARSVRKSSPPKVRVRTRIDHARGGMTG
jgi:hypothetical protein